MSDAVIPVLIGVVSALTTLVLTPRLQHYFWGYQRMSELRLRTCEQLNSLAADFLHNYLRDPDFRPGDQFFRSLMVTSADIKVLFSRNVFDQFKFFSHLRHRYLFDVIHASQHSSLRGGRPASHLFAIMPRKRIPLKRCRFGR